MSALHEYLVTGVNGHQYTALLSAEDAKRINATKVVVVDAELAAVEAKMVPNVANKARGAASK